MASVLDLELQNAQQVESIIAAKVRTLIEGSPTNLVAVMASKFSRLKRREQEVVDEEKGVVWVKLVEILEWKSGALFVQEKIFFVAPGECY